MIEFISSEEFNVERLYKKREKHPTRCYVILNGSKTRTIISGVVLEKCVRFYDCYLVFMTHDCPFEEGLTVSLLNKNGKLLEDAHIFCGYATDDFSDLKLYPPNNVTFDFLYRGLWSLTVLLKSKFSLASCFAFFTCWGVFKQVRFKTYFQFRQLEE